LPISAVTADGSGLWVGTSGQGLYRWDGEEFAKRYLARDSSLFYYVNCLAFNHDHLYVGTDSGMFIFDGGRWKTLTAEDGLPSDYIKDIDATTWVVYVATEAGVTSYFNGDIMPVKKLADKEVNSLVLLGRKVIVGTDYEGVLVKSGPALRTLIDPTDPTAQRGVDIFSVSL
jgi:ligand-binding sensor domain-containing protein